MGKTKRGSVGGKNRPSKMRRKEARLSNRMCEFVFVFVKVEGVVWGCFALFVQYARVPLMWVLSARAGDTVSDIVLSLWQPRRCLLRSAVEALVARQGTLATALALLGMTLPGGTASGGGAMVGPTAPQIVGEMMPRFRRRRQDRRRLQRS
jgi:hypothetical protein